MHIFGRIMSGEVEQVFRQVPKYEKMKELTKFIDDNDGRNVLIFVHTKRIANFIAVMLCEQKKFAFSVHEDCQQIDKMVAKQYFVSGLCKILVATSAAVCSPDIKRADLVVNYDLPASVEEYVLRTGRAGHKAISFFDIDHDSGLAADLAVVLRKANQPLPDFLQVSGPTAPKEDDANDADDATNADDATDADDANDTEAVTSEIPAALQTQDPAPGLQASLDGQELTPQERRVEWCCIHSRPPRHGWIPRRRRAGIWTQCVARY